MQVWQEPRYRIVRVTKDIRLSPNEVERIRTLKRALPNVEASYWVRKAYPDLSIRDAFVLVRNL